ncbi:MAG: hypothetical protein EA349_12985 [Halomonadaceae bacterium]|nr:MAG: hypothetical protein EA349_12985 [Halomonadaceae bacterium]
MSKDNFGKQLPAVAEVFEMTKVLYFWLVVCLFMTQLAKAAESHDAHRYLTESIVNYGSAKEACQRQQAVRALPGRDVLSELAEIDIHSVRIFLVGKSIQAEDRCAESELLGLAIAILSLEDTEVGEKTEIALQSIKQLAFSEQRWLIQNQYRQLPENVKKRLESMAYFEKPFDALAVEKALLEK